MNSDTIDLLIIQPLMNSLAERLTSRFRCHYLYEHNDIDSYLARNGDKIRAVATRGDVGLDAAIMAKLPKLEIISVFGVGTDGIDLLAAAERNIIITITADVLTDDVADLAMGLLIASSRQLISQDKFARTGQWLKSSPALGNKVTGKKIGIVGLGKIGRAIAQRAVPFNMSIGYCDNYAATEDGYRPYASIKELAAFCDYLILALPGSKANKGIINAEILQALGPDGFLINIARGSLVNEDDLVKALREGTIKGAALDVYGNEPYIPEELFAMDNVVITPHIASATIETRDDMAKNVYDNLEGYFSQGKPITPMSLKK